MEQAFSDMLYLFACGARGVQPVINHQLNMQEIHRLAKKQGIWPVVFVAVKSLYQQGISLADEQLYKTWNDTFYARVMLEAKRHSFIHSTVQSLEQQGIACRLLKGEAVASLYAVPSSRVSGDTDVLIDKDKEQQLCSAMRELGFEVEDRSHISHHVVCRHPASGVMEFHLRLYDELFEDVWFNNQVQTVQPFREFTTEDGHTYHTLGIYDGLIFITLHFTKHFLNRGSGIRQMMDLLLYMERYREEIDWDNYKAFLQHLKYEKFIAVCCEIGRQYLQFESSSFPAFSAGGGGVPKRLIQRIFEDIEDGGVFGYDDEMRKNFYQAYTRLRFERFKQGEDYKGYIKRWSKNTFWHKLFPEKKLLYKKYPYLNKYPFLLPFAWAYRGVHFIYRDVLFKKRFHSEEQQRQRADKTKERIELIKDLDMI